jgi:hypothetical protein
MHEARRSLDSSISSHDKLLRQNKLLVPTIVIENRN